jgi:hypothetical protein
MNDSIAIFVFITLALIPILYYIINSLLGYNSYISLEEYMNDMNMEESDREFPDD